MNGGLSGVEIAEGNWRSWIGQLVYRRPYEDAWGMLHDPTTEWDELFKYYRSWVQLLVDEGTRRMARPASAGVGNLLHRGGRRRKAIAELEADYLEWNDRRKQWKRRQRKKARAEAEAAPHEGALSGA
jgi:hypothetical protein